MKSVLLTAYLLMGLCSSAQDARHDMVHRLGMLNVWERHEMAELSKSDQFDRIVYTDSGTVGNYSMDLEGYLLCVAHFESASSKADSIYDNATIVLMDSALPKSANQALDAAFMEKAYRTGEARMRLKRVYRVSATQKLELFFVSNDKQRQFIMNLEQIAPGQ